MSDPGNTFATASDLGTLGAEQVINDSIGRSGDTNDYFKFTTASAGRFNLSLSGLTSDADVRLLGSSGDFIGRSVNSGNNPESISRDLAAGTYYVSVYPYSGSTNYRLAMSVTSATTPVSPPSGDTGNTLGTARNLGALSAEQVINESIGVSGDTNDYFQFSMASAGRFNLSLSGLTSDADVRLLGSSGDFIGRSVNSGNNPERISRDLAAGTYYVSVYPYSGSTNYRLAMSATGATTPLPTLSIAPAWWLSADKNEGNSGTTPFTFNVTRSSATGTSTVNWALAHGTSNASDASDFTGTTNGMLSFVAGETTKTITLNVVGDYVVENNENISVNLSGATGATIATASAAGTIRNDDILGADINVGPIRLTQFPGGSSITNNAQGYNTKGTGGSHGPEATMFRSGNARLSQDTAKWATDFGAAGSFVLPAYSVADGTLIAVGPNALGNALTIKHQKNGREFYATYGHLKSFDAAKVYTQIKTAVFNIRKDVVQRNMNDAQVLATYGVARDEIIALPNSVDAISDTSASNIYNKLYENQKKATVTEGAVLGIIGNTGAPGMPKHIHIQFGTKTVLLNNSDHASRVADGRDDPRPIVFFDLTEVKDGATTLFIEADDDVPENVRNGERLRRTDIIGTSTEVGGYPADRLFGTGEAERIFGLKGNDELKGEGGDDELYGGRGRDTLNGGTGNDLLFGGVGNDSLIGDVGEDTLFGGVGNDALSGGIGNDTLSGDAGADTFRFIRSPYNASAANDGTDIITDFSSAQGDKIQVVARNFGLTAGASATLSTAYSGTSAQFRYSTANGQLWFDRDGTDSNYGEVHLATLSKPLGSTTHPTLSAANIQLVAA